MRTPRNTWGGTCHVVPKNCAKATKPVLTSNIVYLFPKTGLRLGSWKKRGGQGPSSFQVPRPRTLCTLNSETLAWSLGPVFLPAKCCCNTSPGCHILYLTMSFNPHPGYRPGRDLSLASLSVPGPDGCLTPIMQPPALPLIPSLNFHGDPVLTLSRPPGILSPGRVA